MLIKVGQNIRVDLVLRPGEQTQTVTVIGELPAVDTTDATLGGTVSNQSINVLPLNGRNFDRLLQLWPGIITSPGATSGSSATNGRRSIDDLLLVDGIAQIDQTAATGTGIMQVAYRGGDRSSLMPIDAIQEFNTESLANFGCYVQNGGILTPPAYGTIGDSGRDLFRNRPYYNITTWISQWPRSGTSRSGMASNSEWSSSTCSTAWTMHPLLLILRQVPPDTSEAPAAPPIRRIRSWDLAERVISNSVSSLPTNW